MDGEPDDGIVAEGDTTWNVAITSLAGNTPILTKAFEAAQYLSRALAEDTDGAVTRNSVCIRGPHNAVLHVGYHPDNHCVMVMCKISVAPSYEASYSGSAHPSWLDSLDKRAAATAWHISLADAFIKGDTRPAVALETVIAKLVNGNHLWRILVAGYHHGGALANLLSTYMATLHITADVRCITFDAPRIANLQFARLYGYLVDYTYSLSSDRDPLLRSFLSNDNVTVLQQPRRTWGWGRHLRDPSYAMFPLDLLVFLEKPTPENDHSNDLPNAWTPAPWDTFYSALQSRVDKLEVHDWLSALARPSSGELHGHFLASISRHGSTLSLNDSANIDCGQPPREGLPSSPSAAESTTFVNKLEAMVGHVSKKLGAAKLQTNVCDGELHSGDSGSGSLHRLPAHTITNISLLDDEKSMKDNPPLDMHRIAQALLVGKVKQCALASWAAYYDEAIFKHLTGLADVVALNQDKAFVGWVKSASKLVFAFRGTASVQDVLADIRHGAQEYPFMPPGFSGATVHTGFLGYLHEVMMDPGQGPNIFSVAKQLVGSGRVMRIILTGHSLGGAVATLAAPLAAAAFPQADVRCVTFGAPRVGNYKFRMYFEAVVGLRVRVVFGGDPVPTLPPGYEPDLDCSGVYTHVPFEVHMSNKGVSVNEQHQLPRPSNITHHWMKHYVSAIDEYSPQQLPLWGDAELKPVQGLMEFEKSQQQQRAQQRAQTWATWWNKATSWMTDTQGASATPSKQPAGTPTAQPPHTRSGTSTTHASPKTGQQAKRSVEAVGDAVAETLPGPASAYLSVKVDQGSEREREKITSRSGQEDEGSEVHETTAAGADETMSAEATRQVDSRVAGKGESGCTTQGTEGSAVLSLAGYTGTGASPGLNSGSVGKGGGGREYGEGAQEETAVATKEAGTN